MELQQLESSYPQLYIALRLKLITNETFYTFFNEHISIDLLNYLEKKEVQVAAQLVQKWYDNGQVDPVIASMVKNLRKMEDFNDAVLKKIKKDAE